MLFLHFTHYYKLYENGTCNASESWIWLENNISMVERTYTHTVHSSAGQPKHVFLVQPIKAGHSEDVAFKLHRPSWIFITCLAFFWQAGTDAKHCKLERASTDKVSNITTFFNRIARPWAWHQLQIAWHKQDRHPTEPDSYLGNGLNCVNCRHIQNRSRDRHYNLLSSRILFTPQW
jgi:hypothetical protein